MRYLARCPSVFDIHTILDSASHGLSCFACCRGEPPSKSDRDRRYDEEEEEEEEILGSDDDEQEDPRDYVKGMETGMPHPFSRVYIFSAG